MWVFGAGRFAPGDLFGMSVRVSKTIPAPAVVELAAIGFEGTATELLEQLTALVGEEIRKQRGWPKQPHTLSGRLRRLAPALRRTGVEVEFERIAGGVRTRTIRIRQLEQTGNQASQASRSVPDGEGGTLRDARDALSQALLMALAR